MPRHCVLLVLRQNVGADARQSLDRSMFVRCLGYCGNQIICDRRDLVTLPALLFLTRIRNPSKAEAREEAWLEYFEVGYIISRREF